jgi:RND family efflux transporter MFP subunit
MSKWIAWRAAVVVAAMVGLAQAHFAMAANALAPAAPALATAAVQSARAGGTTGYDGVVEAVRQTVIAAQVAGAVTALDVRVGDRVQAGQVLARIDARAADQNAAAGDAQVRAANASLDLAAKDFERQQQLFGKNYISQAALERAEAQFKAAQAQVAAQRAQAASTRTQTGFFVVRAPYAGIVSEVPLALGDMAMPGRALLTLYDPLALRVSVAVPQSAQFDATVPATTTTVDGGASKSPIKVQFPGLPGAREWAVPSRVSLLPGADPGTHTQQLRLELPAGLAGLSPGMFARVWLPVSGEASAARLYAPATAIVRRAEMTAVYVVDAAGRPVLRQVRLGAASGDVIEILSGVSAGERVARDPQAAARVR